jgi:hypothetical protein
MFNGATYSERCDRISCSLKAGNFWNNYQLCEISGPHDGEYEDDSLPGYCAL